ncbi:MAG: ABC transporter permease [Gemmatimonadaceae bacterium]|nr:ABC transporter permease [Gemmatimonadaceae bacterium]
MVNRLELEIAWRYLRSRGRTRLFSFISLIAIGGIVVGVSALILIIGVMNGLQTDLREKILVGSPDFRVLVFGDDLKINGWRAVQAKVSKVDGVVAVAPFVLTQALANAGHDYTEGVSVSGIEPTDSATRHVTSIRSKAIMGDFSFTTADGKRRGAVVGKLLAERLSAYPGQPGTQLTMVSAAGLRPDAVLGQLIPRVATFEVTGVFETGMYEYDNAYVFVDLNAAQEFAGLDSAVTGLEVATTDRWAAPLVAERVSTALEFPYHTVDWQEQNSSLFRALKLEKLGMGVILLLIILVAAFNIVSTLTMVVRDKTREIGILKAMGATEASIRRIFLIQGTVIGCVGTLAGTLLGGALGLAVDRYRLITLDPTVYFIDHLPVRLELGDTVLMALLGFAVAALATLYPARQASRLYPIEAIRDE